MDNASKALIMAGAILIAVALVGVGVYLYQSAAGMMDSGVSELASADMITKNGKLEMYEGTSTGAELKTLMKQLNSYNKNSIYPAPVYITGDSGISESGGVMSLPTGTNAISNSATFNVTIKYDNAGWVSEVEAKKAN